MCLYGFRGELRLFQFGHEVVVAQVDSHPEHHEHAGAAEEETSDGKAGLFEEVLKAVDGLEHQRFSCALEDGSGEGMHEMEGVFSGGLGIDHEKRVDMVGGDDFD